MIKTILGYLVTVLLMAGMFTCTHKALAEKSITLPKDTIIFKSDFNEASAAGFINNIMTHQGNIIPIYMDSPGGSVFALDQMIAATKAVGKKTVCFVGFAASAAFMFVNSVCDVRVVQPSSVLMSHQASTGYRGEVNRIESFKKLVDSMLLRLDSLVSTRLGISVEDFREKSRDEWWTSGADAEKEGLADVVTNLKCSAEMTNERYTEVMQIFIFTLELTWSRCPLLPYPVMVNGAPTFTSKLPVSVSGRERFEAHKNFYKNFGQE